MLMHLADGFTVAAVVAGLWAAWLWQLSASLPTTPRQVKDMDPEFDAMPGPLRVVARYVFVIGSSAEQGGKLNRRAATWTAVSVATQAIATVIGRLAATG